MADRPKLLHQTQILDRSKGSNGEVGSRAGCPGCGGHVPRSTHQRPLGSRARFRLPGSHRLLAHGEVARAYGTFNEKMGVALRTTFVLDGDGVVRQIIASDSLGTPREHDEYAAALATI